MSGTAPSKTSTCHMTSHTAFFLGLHVGWTFRSTKKVWQEFGQITYYLYFELCFIVNSISFRCCQLYMASPCEVCKSWSAKTWRQLRKSLLNARAKAAKKGVKHWSTVFLFLNDWLEQPFSINSGHLSETSLTRESLQELDSGQDLPVYASGHESNSEAPQIMPSQAPSIDQVSSTW